MSKNYFLGLDVGTNSVGWAVTDERYNLIRKKGKDLWGIRLFPEAEGAEIRRNKRSARRRLQRRKERLNILNSIFEKEIKKIDPEFFNRLENSQIYPEDKGYKFNIFNDKNYTDKNFSNDYPTLYHLREELIKKDKKHDIRLIYLALHSMFKNRGHFLFSEELGEGTKTYEEILNTFRELISNNELYIEIKDENALKDILSDETLRKSEIQKKLKDYFAIRKTNDIEMSFIKLITGSPVNLYNIFENESERFNKEKIDLSDENFEIKLSEVEPLLSDDEVFTINQAKEIYDWLLLKNIMNNQKYLCEAKILEYEKHKSDLKKLKKVINDYFKTEYENVFLVEDKKIKNYVAYTKHTSRSITDIEKINVKQCTQEEFCAFIKKIISAEKESINDRDYEYIISEVENNTLCPKLRNKSNSVIPHQLNLQEIKAILKNAAKHYPFLLDKDEDGISNCDKLISTFNFRIPYFVGPLNKHSNFSWIEKNKEMENEKIYPWNFDKIVNLDKTAEKFIRRMTSKCTYLFNEDVLPKNSLLYSKFVVLNEINNIRLNEKPIDIRTRNLIFEKLFLKVNKVTPKKITDLLKRETAQKDFVISGIDIQINSSMEAYIKLKTIIRDKVDNADYTDIIEEVIKIITILGEDRKAIERNITAVSNGKFSPEEIKSLSKLKFVGWGRLSKKFLTEIKAEVEEVGYVSIMEALEKSNLNLMKLLSNRYGYLNAIEEENSKNTKSEKLQDLIDELYVSPAVKRSITQATKITEEIVKVMGCEPKKIFIEMARGEEEKNKRTTSRKNQLLEIYKSIKNDNSEFIRDFFERGKFEKLESCTDADLLSKKRYLYFTQLGMDIYTGKKINYEDIFNENLYDIDHIYPRSRVKDDSLTKNLVLTSKEYNEKIKENKYPIRESDRSGRAHYWKILLDKNLISEEKYKRLIRGSELTVDELASFIDRQLVFTRQSTKAIANILGTIYKNSRLVYAKAENTSEFRQKFDIPKSRLISDVHHAHDAYLAIVVGNVYDVKFTANPYKRLKENLDYNLRTLFERDVIRGNEIAWVAKNSETINLVKNKVLKRNTALFTRYQKEYKGELSEATLLNKYVMKKKVEENSIFMPLKGINNPLNDVRKYGGYDSISTAYFFVVEHSIKKKRNITIEVVLLPFAHNIKNVSDLEEYSEEVLGLIDPKIIVNKIRISSLINFDGFIYAITGRGDSRILVQPMIQVYYSDFEIRYSKLLEKAKEKMLKNSSYKINEFDKLTKNDNLKIYDSIVNKIEDTIFSKRVSIDCDFLEEKRDVFKKLNLEDQVIVLLEFFKYTMAKNFTVDLRKIGGKEKSGFCRIGKNITNCESFEIINTSITGLFEERIVIKNGLENSNNI